MRAAGRKQGIPRQDSLGRRRLGGAAAMVALVVVGLALASCSSEREWTRGTADRFGDNCVWQGGSDGQARVINYADPELCGRMVEVRGAEHVRTPRPAPDSSGAQ